jgi:hypothetical protein
MTGGGLLVDVDAEPRGVGDIDHAAPVRLAKT